MEDRLEVPRGQGDTVGKVDVDEALRGQHEGSLWGWKCSASQ